LGEILRMSQDRLCVCVCVVCVYVSVCVSVSVSVSMSVVYLRTYICRSTCARAIISSDFFLFSR
jgi:hypothetical protein